MVHVIRECVHMSEAVKTVVRNSELIGTRIEKTARLLLVSDIIHKHHN